MSDEASPIRILVVDDHPVVRAGKMLLCDVAADDIARYQAGRLEQGAAPRKAPIAERIGPIQRSELVDADLREQI